MIQYRLMREQIASAGRFEWQFYLILGISVLCSLTMAFIRSTRIVLIFIKMGLLFLLIFPLGGRVWIGMSLLLSFWIEIAAYLDWPRNLPFMILMLFYGALLFKPRSAFYARLSAPDEHELISFLILGAVFIALLALLTRSRKMHHADRMLIKRLDDALSTMGKANLGFQNYSSSLELETLKKERKRVSREIHDTVGYSLTNIRIMLEAASMMIGEDRAGAEELIRKSMEEAGFCLEETRSAMRLLRSKETGRAVGLRAFFKLVSAFADATGIKVHVEFGNSPDSFGVRIDKAVFRFIQEGLTNSFRHGRASEIRIYFWIQDRVLKISLQDNGKGSAELNEGIGLAGMRERLNELGGMIDYHNVAGGFEISMTIPLPEDLKNRSTE